MSTINSHSCLLWYLSAPRVQISLKHHPLRYPLVPLSTASQIQDSQRNQHLCSKIDV
uniref:Beta-galactosidase n=1 Tax=Rhizophora mucronata TaxID=61149 RepID=A0A2P2M5U7_RHIMU